jgi:hypothetical protein
MTKYFTLEDLKNVMNLAMMLRQNQLSGHSDKSGNEVLAEYVLTHGETLGRIHQREKREKKENDTH